MKKIVYLSIAVLLQACSEPPLTQDVQPATRIVIKKQTPPAVPIKVHATYGIGNDPAVVKAYKRYLSSGVAEVIHSDSFITYGYNAYEQPMMSCAPMHLCIIQLEEGEAINNINIGDSAHWLVTTARIGAPEKGSFQVVLKPTLLHLATDMVITTDKRTYHLGLVSQDSGHTQVINFYYPKETLEASNQFARSFQINHIPRPEETRHHSIRLSDIHFQYKIKGDRPPWRPIRVFDDGQKTFIQMPQVVKQLDLPVLYLLEGHNMQLVNYRYQAPYYVVDGLFHKALLISGKGRSQISVSLTNQSRLLG